MSPALRLLWIGLAVLAAACAAPAREPVPDFSRHAAERMFVVGFSDILDIYIEKPVIADLALAGLKGLRALDPAIGVAEEKAELRLAVNGKPAGVAPRAADDDPEGWAKVVVDLLEAGRKASPQLARATSEEIYEAMFEGIVSRLDPYTRYAGAEKARENRAKREGFGGIGIAIETHEDGARVVTVRPEMPAAKAGILSGDRIVAVNGAPIAGYALRRIIRLLRGPIGQPVTLTLRRDGRAEPFKLSIVRTRIVRNTVFYKRRGDVGYIRVTGFNQETARRLDDAARRARREIGSRIRGLVIDMRGNPGGLLDQAVATADLFLRNGQITSTRGRHPDSLQLFDATEGDVSEGLPIAVLVDGASASAAEIVASALQDHGRAVIVGTRSFGKGTVQTVLRLPNDGELVLTWARIHAPSGYVLHRLGVMPTVCTSDVEDAASVLETLLADGERVRRNLVLRRSVDGAGPERRKLVQTLCPWHPRADKDLDLAVAEELLKRRELYDRVLAFARPAAGS